MSNDSAPTGDPHTGLSHTTAVVCGHLGSSRSAVGFLLARHLHRPCIDFAAATVGAASEPPLGHFTAERARAERTWFEAAIGSNFAEVVVAPCAILNLLPLPATAPKIWTAWLDVDEEELIDDARARMPDLDVDAFRDHVRELRPGGAVCDVVVDTRGRSDVVVARRLSDLFRTTAPTRNRPEVAPT